MPKQTVAVMLESEQLAMIRQYAKDHGYESTSAGLRRMLQEWQQMKTAQVARERRLVDTQETYETR